MQPSEQTYTRRAIEVAIRLGILLNGSPGSTPIVAADRVPGAGSTAGGATEPTVRAPSVDGRRKHRGGGERAVRTQARWYGMTGSGQSPYPWTEIRTYDRHHRHRQARKLGSRPNSTHQPASRPAKIPALPPYPPRVMGPIDSGALSAEDSGSGCRSR